MGHAHMSSINTIHFDSPARVGESTVVINLVVELLAVTHMIPIEYLEYHLNSGNNVKRLQHC
jgi:hypothetical protein